MMDEDTLQRSLRARPPADPTYQPRLTAPRATAEGAPSIRQGRAWIPQGALPGRFQPAISLRAFAAIVAVALAIGVAIGVGSGLPSRNDVGSGPSPSPSLTPAASPTPGVEGTPQPIGQGPVLTWTKVVPDERSLKPPDPASRVDSSATRIVWLGDRFVLVDEDANAVSTSTDGQVWETVDESHPDRDYYQVLTRRSSTASWQDHLVGWSEASASGVLQIVRPPSEPVTKSDFEGSVASVGIGPAGIVALVRSDFDHDALVTTFLGPGWVEHMTTYQREDGVIRITTDDGRSAEIVLAEHGIEEGDPRSFGWYSPDGDRWTRIPAFPPNMQEVVGVADGFIARGEGEPCDGCVNVGMWHSPDGLAWRLVGPTVWDRPVLPWEGGALVVERDRGRFVLWTAEGPHELPMTAELPDRSTDLPMTAAVPYLSTDWTQLLGAGPLGIVSVDSESQKVLFSPDGIVWSIAAIPDEMAEAAGGHRNTVAVGERSVVIITWSGNPEAPIPSLWLGTLEP